MTSLLVSCALIAPYATVLAQSINVKEVTKLKQELPVAELDDSFVAIKASSPYSYDMGMVFYYSMLGSFLGGFNSIGQKNQLTYLDLLWTKGDVVSLGGEAFLACYRVDVTSIMIAGEDRSQFPQVDTLRLHLVKMSTIGSISPYGDVTPSEFREAFAVPDKERPMTQQQMSAAQTTAVSNAKQIALGMLMYCADYDDITPYAQSTATVQWVTMPYLKNMKIWETGNPNNSRFIYNPAIAGVNMTDVEEPAATVLYYESAPWPDRRRVVAYNDGHVKLLTEEEWATVSKTLKLKIKKSAKPLPADYGLKELAEYKSRSGG